MTLSIEPGTTRIGWIGTGVMGHSMCGHLLQSGYDVTVFSRTQSRADDLVARGARWANSPAEVAQNSDVVISIVGFPDDVREVILGDRNETGALSGCQSGNVLVDMTTSRPALAIEIYQAAKTVGVYAIDAPVSGGDVGAREASLSIMIGGDKEIAESLDPIWNVLGRTIVYQGPAGAGQHTKMVNQTIIASGMIGVCEGLLYAYRAGLDLESVMRSVQHGAAGSWSLSNLGPRIIDNQFDPGFFVEHFVKDMSIALEEAQKLGLVLPGLTLAQHLYHAVMAQGDKRLGTHVLQKALARMSGVDWENRSV